MPLRGAEAEGEQERILVLALNPRRAFDDSYRGFVEIIQGQLLSAISMANAYETEQRRLESLKELDRVKVAFFQNISHEFRTPLTLLLGPVERLLSDEQHPLIEEHREDVKMISRNAARLLRLVNSLLDFSRVEAGRVKRILRPWTLRP